MMPLTEKIFTLAYFAIFAWAMIKQLTPLPYSGKGKLRWILELDK